MMNRLLRVAHAEVLALGLCASMAIGSLGFAAQASAQVPVDDHSDKGNLCRVFQEGYDQAVELYGSAAPGSDAEKYAEKLMDVYMTRWLGSDCDSDYGNIAFKNVVLGSSLNKSGGTLQSTTNFGTTSDHPAKAPITRGLTARP